MDSCRRIAIPSKFWSLCILKIIFIYRLYVFQIFFDKKKIYEALNRALPQILSLTQIEI